MNEKRGFVKNLILALAFIPIVSFVGLIVITLIGALDDAITKIQSAGNWWLILVVAFVLSLVYVFCEPKICQNKRRKRLLDGLILYWREQIKKRGETQRLEEGDLTREELLERIKIWEQSNPELWAKHFPDERYSKYLFEIVDNFIEHWRRFYKRGRKRQRKTMII